MLHILGILEFYSSRNVTCGRNNSGRNEQMKGFLEARHCVFEDLQRCANWRRLTDGSDHSRNINPSMWPNNVLTVLCYFLSAFLRWARVNYISEVETFIYFLVAISCRLKQLCRYGWTFVANRPRESSHKETRIPTCTDFLYIYIFLLSYIKSM